MILCRYIFMAMYSFVPPSHEAKFHGVPLCLSALGRKSLWNTDLMYLSVIQVVLFSVVKYPQSKLRALTVCTGFT
jgi:hypothetical protein